MERRAGFFLSLAVLLVTSCTPTVDRTMVGFNEASFDKDLSECRGGTAGKYALNSVIGAAVGSAVGAAEGAAVGAVSGGSGEGALLGTIVGGIIGTGVGIGDALSDQDSSMATCLSEKGYTIVDDGINEGTRPDEQLNSMASMPLEAGGNELVAMSSDGRNPSSTKIENPSPTNFASTTVEREDAVETDAEEIREAEKHRRNNAPIEITPAIKKTISLEPINAEFVTIADAFVLSEPNASARRLETLPENSLVMVISRVKQRNWYMVNLENSDNGFIWKGFVKRK